ncbi:DUF4129 domain-containing protein [Martelella endophytica]|uniref:Protein-glutamine gamma-glutamyltransferase-like C-terminal domain-containing protein n=1 Tax=Martelella endophytica TaxID=1486262 RepID=A0A0D5LNS9_MAREN|nr:DUF4129 domain-containing protein [Martelella endophytica]AJY45605.1 hypothetical protein TM49_07820 [Martelella endophytica]
MKAESRILSAIYATLLLVMASFGSGCTNAAEPSQAPPRSPSGEAYLAAVQGMGLQTDITYSSGEKEAPELPDSRSGDNFSIGKTTGWALLAFMVLALAVLAYRSRNMFAELAGSNGGRVLSATAEPEEAAPTAIDHDLIERLRSEPDHREGLRAVLQRFLALAAQENSIPVKRSLTTREIMQRLPGSFTQREQLETLAMEVERVVFGGHSIDPEQYQHCLDLAAPFLRRARS